MVDITNFTKVDTASRTQTTIVEETNYTVSWSNLTTAGFGNGDDVIILYTQWLSDNSSSIVTSEFKIGSTYALATTHHTNVIQGEVTTVSISGRSVGYLGRHTLATNDNLYWSLGSDSGSGWSSDFSLIVLKLDDLSADDFRWVEDDTFTGNAPTAITTAVSVTLPSTSGDDWLILADGKWTADDSTNPMNTRINTHGCKVKVEAGGTSDQFSCMCVGYVDNATASQQIDMEYWQGSGGINDFDRAAMFALRLQAFEDSIGTVDISTTNSISVLDTYVEVESQDLVLGTTGDVLYFAQAIGDVSLATQVPYHKVEMDGTPVETGMGRDGYRARDAGDELPVQAWGKEASVSSGTRTFTIDVAEDNDVASSYNVDMRALVVFSVALAGGSIAPQVVHHLKQMAGS